MKLLYEQSEFPVLQNRVYDSADEAINCIKGEIRIVENSQTGLIQNDLFNPNLLNYDQNYNNEQGFSLAFQNHLIQAASLVEDHLGRTGLLEVGCGKGFFLEMLLGRGNDVLGFDATYEGNNPRIIKKNFEPGIISKPARALILRHVLEHIPNPYDFLCSLRDANGGSGLIYIEVPCLEWIINKRAWYDIFYEHVNYFRLHDFQRFFGKVVKCGRMFGGQYLFIIAELSSLRRPVKGKSDSVEFPSDFLEGLKSIRHPAVVWGGASKGVVFSLLCNRLGKPITMAIDSNPFKQGKFLPATGIPVISPETAMAVLPNDTIVYVMNSNYLEEIKKMSSNKFQYKTLDL